MKKLLKLVSFITALVMVAGVMPVSVSALKLENYDYKFPGANSISRDVENGTEPVAAAYFDSTVKYSGEYSLKMVSEPVPTAKKEFRVGIKMNKLQKNKDYKIAFMLKAQNMNAFSLTITNQSNWWQLGNVLGKNFDWMPVELEFNYPSDNPAASAVFIVSNSCEGIWIDDLKLYERLDGGAYSEVAGVFENGGFDEYGTTPVISAGDAELDEDGEKQIPLTESDAVIVKEAKNIKLDGDASDWAEYSSIPIETWYPIVQEDVTLEADIKYAYDDEALYYLVQVQDEAHKYVRGSSYWQGDGIQSAVDNNNTNGFGIPFGMFYDEEEDRLVFISDNGGAEMDTTAPDSVKGAAKRSGNTTTYEVKIPWSQTGAEKSDKVKFNLIINDNDVGVRKGWLQISNGIGDSKNSSFFPYIYLGEKGGGIASAKLLESQIQMNEKFKCEISYSNVRRQPIDIEINYGDSVQTVSIAPMTRYVNTVEFDDFSNIGGYEKVITLNDGEQTYSLSVSGSIIPDDAFIDNFGEMVGLWIEELTELRDKCTERGLATDYEDADIKLLEVFLEETFPYEKEAGQYGRMAHIYDVLPGIYEECRDSLLAVLSGEKEPVDVPEYVTSEIEIRDGAYWATVEKGGVQYESPVTFNGVCSFLSPARYTEDFDAYGMNHAEIGIYASMFLNWNGKEFETIPEEERYGRRSDEYAWERVIQQLEDCEKKGISVSFMASPMAWPHMDEYGYSDYKHSTNHSYMPMNPTHPMVEVVADAVFKEVGKLCEKYECIDNICLINEPTVKLVGNPYYEAPWAEFLKERYNGDIEWLNKVYGGDADYKDFTEIEMPSAVTYGVPVYHDYRMFCEDVYHQFVKTLSNAARKYTDLPLCIKEMQRARWYNGDYTLNMATTIEKNKEFIDLAGCDAFFLRSNPQLALDVKMMWYDYITSVMEAPVQNGEDHIGSDGQGGVESKFWDDNSYKASTWQGMIHGGGAQAIWYYGAFDRMLQQGGVKGEFEPMANMLQLPNSLRDSYRNNLDGMRLANEVNALYTAPRNVGILWANTSWGYNAKFMNGLYRAYNNAIYNGQRVRFVTEYTLEQLDKVKMLVIPGTTHILPDTLEAIKKYAENGGKIIFIGEDCLSFDDYNQLNDRETVDYIRSKARVIESDVLAMGGTINLPENYDEIMTEEYAKAGLMNVVLKDAETGEMVEGVEWISNDLNGKTIINPFNYNLEGSKTVEIWINGEKAERFTDIKNSKSYNGAITLESHEPYLIEVGGDDGFVDVSHVEWAHEGIYGLYDKGVVNGVGERRFAPDNGVTREELCKMITASAGLNIDAYETPFTDVDKNAWYSPYVETAYREGVVKGISETSFGTGLTVSRQELAAMVYRAAVKTGDISADESAVNSFSDAENCADYANEAIAVLYANGIINGSDNNMFKPADFCTRAEAAKIIYNTFFK